MIRVSFAALALVLAGCAGRLPEVRPLTPQSLGAASPFERVYQAGKAHFGAERIGLALVMFQQALKIDPLSVAALNATGAAYDELHRPDIAGTYYATALALEPRSADTLNN